MMQNRNNISLFSYLYMYLHLSFDILYFWCADDADKTNVVVIPSLYVLSFNYYRNSLK